MNSKRRLTQMLSFISATLGIVCIACFFFPFLSVTSENGSESFYTGIEVALGYSDSIIKMGMNILLVVTFALLILTAINGIDSDDQQEAGDLIAHIVIA